MLIYAYIIYYLHTQTCKDLGVKDNLCGTCEKNPDDPGGFKLVNAGMYIVMLYSKDASETSGTEVIAQMSAIRQLSGNICLFEY